MVRTCSVYGCLSSTTLHKGLRFHRFPRDERCQSWVDACQRPDLKDKNMEQLYNLYVCSLHFEKWMYMSMKLKDAAIPVLNLPCASIYPMSTQTEAPRKVITEDSREIQTQGDDHSEEVSVTVSTSVQASQTAEKLTDDSRRKRKLQNIKTDINTEKPLKQETEECFSEHEDNIEEQLENRKRQHETDPLETNKMMKPDNSNHKTFSVLIPQKPEYGTINKPKSITLVDILPQTSLTNPEARSGVDNPKQKPEQVLTVKGARDKDKTRFSIDFMRKVLSSQEEILTVLKSQVLLQNPDPDLLTFLRLVGAKLSRFDDVKRRNIQSAIIDLISKN